MDAMTQARNIYACPVCRARFREAAVCPRCGADLAPIMRIAVEAWRKRQAARRCIECRQYTAAATLAREAEALCATPEGSRLRILCNWLLETASGTAAFRLP